MPGWLLAVLASAAAATGPTPAAPAPDAAIRGGPRTLAGQMTAADAGLRTALATWPRQDPPPPPVTLPSLFLQLALRRLARQPRLRAATLAHLRPRLAHTTREVTAALAALRRLSAGGRPHRMRVGPAEPLAALSDHYRAAQRRFGVGPPLLAAVNLVESAFGRVRSHSVAGAQGPMQFLPATWRIYGLGGDVHRPRDAILGAAHLLARAGAPADRARALYAYNPSPLYVDAVRRFAGLIARDRAALPFFYSWQVFVRTARGERRLTGPGR